MIESIKSFSGCTSISKFNIFFCISLAHLTFLANEFCRSAHDHVPSGVQLVSLFYPFGESASSVCADRVRECNHHKKNWHTQRRELASGVGAGLEIYFECVSGCIGWGNKKEISQKISSKTLKRLKLLLLQAHATRPDAAFGQFSRQNEHILGKFTG